MLLSILQGRTRALLPLTNTDYKSHDIKHFGKTCKVCESMRWWWNHHHCYKAPLFCIFCGLLLLSPSFLYSVRPGVWQEQFDWGIAVHLHGRSSGWSAGVGADGWQVHNHCNFMILNSAHFTFQRNYFMHTVHLLKWNKLFSFSFKAQVQSTSLVFVGSVDASWSCFHSFSCCCLVSVLLSHPTSMFTWQSNF